MTDICDPSVNSDKTSSSVDPDTGVFTFATTDALAVPNLGNYFYVANFYGIYQGVETKMNYVLLYRMSDPCPDIILTIFEPDPF